MSKYQDPKVGIDARELVKHTFKVTTNTNNFPKKYRLTLVNQIIDTSMEIYNNILDANNTFDIASRIKYQQQAISECRKFRDKIVQHYLCDNYLVPRLSSTCIIDNYAGQIGKGTKFAKDRLKLQLQHFTQHYQNGYIFKGDIHKYYYCINHDIAKKIMHKHYDKELWWLIDAFIESTSGEVGIALGNQINTIISNLYLNELDQYIKNDLKCTYYGRYADDFFIIHNDKKELKRIVSKIKVFVENDLLLKLNEKSQIMPIKNGIKFIGFHFYVQNNKIVCKLANEKERNHRRKFNKLLKKVKNYEFSLDELLLIQQCWEAHALYADYQNISYYRNKLKGVKNMDYISTRQSKLMPKIHDDGNSIVIPIDIKDIDGMYEFKEIRFDRDRKEPVSFEIVLKIIEYTKYATSVVTQNINDMKNISDADCAKNALYLPKFNDLVKEKKRVGKDFKFFNEADAKTYKTMQSSFIFDGTYRPEQEGTESLFSVIDLECTGTQSNPIPYNINMAVEKGKFYSFKNKLYECIRSSGQPLYATPNSLLGNYFKAL